jgi:hypothetical protein
MQRSSIYSFGESAQIERHKATTRRRRKGRAKGKHNSACFSQKAKQLREDKRKEEWFFAKTHETEVFLKEPFARLNAQNSWLT